MLTFLVIAWFYEKKYKEYEGILLLFSGELII